MSRAQLTSFAAPAYLLLALLLGGSTRGIWANMALQLLAIALIAWVALFPAQQWPARAKPLIFVLIAGIVLIFLQLVPLPPGIWTGLAGREPVARGFALLGEELPWLPLSLAPYATLASALALLPPVAIGAVVLLKPQRESWLAAAILAAACLGVILGALQMTSAGPGKSDLYLYGITNSGAVGFFANRNHMGTLLLASLPFAFAMLGTGQKQKDKGQSFAVSGLVGAVIVLLLVGIVLNGSTAVLILGLPVLGFSLLLLPIAGKWRRALALGAMVAAIAAALVLLATPAGGAERLGDLSLSSRVAIWSASVPIANDFLPWGSGLGSFEQVFHLYEDVSATTRTYVNHVHNDYLELVLELGLPGALLVLAFLIWWVRRLSDQWRSPLSSRHARAATIVSAAILAQCLVDYPLRTAAIAALFGACLGLMASASAAASALRRRDAKSPRHVVIG